MEGSTSTAIPPSTFDIGKHNKIVIPVGITQAQSRSYSKKKKNKIKVGAWEVGWIKGFLHLLVGGYII